MAKVIPIVRLEGVIAADAIGPGKTISLGQIESALKTAFDVRSAPAVALVVNSPGGSPVQSSLISKRIRQLAEKKNKHVIAFVEDVAASGGYWLACAADEIILDEASIVGSIGVISAGFGFHAAIERLGIQRRVYTAGAAKSQLDPFRPEEPEQVVRWNEKIDDLHQVFIRHVEARRGTKLKDDPLLFQGEVFVGAKAVSLGLADGVGSMHTVLAERYGESVKLKQIRLEKAGLLSLLLKGTLGEAGVRSIAHLEMRGLWARYGL
jgi:signal peptide peptidase SppA